MLDIKRVLVYTSENAIFLRGSADQVRAARQLVDNMDKPKPEVVIDVLVMETSRSRSRQISTALSGGTALGIPITFTPRSGSSTTKTPLSTLKHLSSADFSVALPGLNLALDASDNQTRILQSPQVRASDGQKASLKIGQRVPFATGSFNAGTGATGTSPLVNTQFSYADVGVNVEVTPHVHGRDELTLHIDIDISNVADHVDIGGVSEPVIGQRKISHEVRLREGQATVLAGLAENQDTRQLNGLPGLLNVPLLRRLFGGDKRDREHTDLLIILIPHIVRWPEYTASNLRPALIGTDVVVRTKPEHHCPGL
jgi:general secretion pathway protein D